MPKVKGPAFYAVRKGRAPGECEAQVSGFPGGTHKKFYSVAEAQEWLGASGQPSARPSAPAPAPAPAGSASVRAPPPPVAHTSRVARPSAKSAPAVVPPPAKAHKSRLETDVIEDETGWDVVYSDGSCRGNGQPGSVAGIGVWWGRNDARNLAERCPGVQTNNRAELIVGAPRLAIVRVLETAPHSKAPLLIKTDSQYSIKCFQEWMPKWLASGWKNAAGAPVKNAPLIRYLSALLGVRGRAGQRVQLQYVRGHVGEEGNEGADRLANRGALLSEAPERDWGALEEALDGAERTLAGDMGAEDLEAYAACLLSPEELEMELMEDSF
ncbi:ribonuclease H-like domain-containing protein [Amylocystis lapponica]|nr:ribonuclease H-like domain-containing protein [Amylocystis lapponica]